jgi:hypothetical protein
MKKRTDRKRRESSKPKKITVKFFVNEMVQPLIDGKTKRYPLYMLITYDRKNTMMRCHYGQYYKDLKEIDKINYPGLLAMEERIIKKTIEYELKQRGDDFDLKGTFKKYEQYSVGIHVLVERYLKDYLWSVLSRLEPFEYVKALKFTDADVTFDTLYKISKRIYKDLNNSLPRNFEQEIEVYRVFNKLYQGTFFQYSFPVVIEWIDSSAVDDYREKLKIFYSDDPSMVKKSVEFINRIVSN